VGRRRQQVLQFEPFTNDPGGAIGNGEQSATFRPVQPGEANFDEPTSGRARYANHIRVGHNAFEFFLDFGQQFDDTGEEQFHTRIVTSPDHFANLVGTALGSLEHYRGQHGSTIAAIATPGLARPSRDRVLSLLAALDGLLKRAGEKAESTFPEPPADATAPYRGLYVTKEDFERLLKREPVAPSASGVAEGAEGLPAIFSEPLLPGIFQTELTAWDNTAIVMALAIDVDARYERIFGWLQDDVTRRRPTVGLALDVLCRNAQERINALTRLDAGSPLVDNGILHLIADPGQWRPSLLDRALELDEQVLVWLLGHDRLDSRVRSLAKLTMSARTESGALPPGLEALAARAVGENRPLCLYFNGTDEHRKRAAAGQLAAALDRNLLRVPATQLTGASSEVLRVLRREALLHRAVLVIEGFDQLLQAPGAPDVAPSWATLGDIAGPTILTGAGEWIPVPQGPTGVVAVSFGVTDYATRLAAWQRELAAAGLPATEKTLDLLANSFKLREDQIADAVATASHRVQLASVANPGEPLLAQSYTTALFESARTRTGHALSELARKTPPVYGWDDIVLPDSLMEQLAEICDRVENRHHVFDEWGFGAKLSGGKGVTVLLSGPPGTGKTMAAEVIANRLGLDLYVIDLSRIVSRYVGETEERLERVFTAAEQTNAILLFNEADALFGKRFAQKDAHDRYANIEVSFLLQRMEMYEGISLLATNLRGNLDEAFLRRLTYVLLFPLPDEALRLRIWQKVWPDSSHQVKPEVDFRRVAAQFKLSGANIRNVALAASFFAAADSTEVTNEHIMRALQREYQKVGRAMSRDEMQAPALMEVIG
jgi:ATP-dependent 26S proteasome regulatory subunit